MDKKAQGQFLGDLEKEVMDTIWTIKEPVPVRFVFEQLAKKRKVAYTTVMTIMARLTEKGVLTRQLNGTSYLYQPKTSKEKFVANAAHRIFKSAISNLGEEVASHFLKEIQKLSPKKRQELLEVLNNK